MIIPIIHVIIFHFTTVSGIGGWGGVYIQSVGIL